MSLNSIEQIRVRTELPRFKEGTVLSPPYLTDEMNAPHGDGITTQVVSLEVTDSGAKTYTFAVEGEVVSYAAEAADDAEAIAGALAAAANANPLVRGLVTATAEVDNTDWFVVLTANLSREQFEITTDDADLALTEPTAGSAGDRFPVARAVYIRNGVASAEPSAPGTAATWASEVAGISTYEYDEEQITVGSNAAGTTKQRFDVVYVRQGVVGVGTAPAAGHGDAVYIETSGDNAGRFYADNSATREAVTGLTWDGPNRLRLQL